MELVELAIANCRSKCKMFGISQYMIFTFKLFYSQFLAFVYALVIISTLLVAIASSHAAIWSFLHTDHTHVAVRCVARPWQLPRHSLCSRICQVAKNAHVGVYLVHAGSIGVAVK